MPEHVIAELAAAIKQQRDLAHADVDGGDLGEGYGALRRLDALTEQVADLIVRENGGYDRAAFLAAAGVDS